MAIRALEACTKKGINIIKQHSTSQNSNDRTYIFQSEGKSNDGFCFKVGDSFRVLEIANDAVLIEKKGDTNNPYCVSADFLRSISDFDC